MSDLSYQIDAPIWLYTGKTAWHFITIPEDISGHIKAFCEQKTPGFGSVRVKVTIGTTSWNTTLFPDSKTKCYGLPIKAGIRKKNKLFAGDAVTLRLDIDI